VSRPTLIFAELVFSLAIALFYTIVFAVAGRRTKSTSRIALFFLIIFLASWAGGVWITPVGPVFLGVYWRAFFIVGLVFALLLEGLNAVSGRPDSRTKDIDVEAKEIEKVVSFVFLILFLAFVIIIAAGYIHRGR
jgi:hypothetical protein